MPNEKPTDGFYWRDELDKLDKLPGEYFNNELSWNKLHQRLHRKSSTKKLAWYWAAAAVLLLVLIVPFLTYHKEESSVAKGESLIIPPQKIITPYSVGDKSSVVKIENIKSARENDFTVNKKIDQRNHNIIQPEKVTDNVRLPGNVSNQLASENLPNTLQPIDTLQKNLVLINLPQKIKLKVVHINEIGEPEPEESVTVRNTETHSFRLKFGNQEIFVNPSITPKATGLTILKTRTPLN